MKHAHVLLLALLLLASVAGAGEKNPASLSQPVALDDPGLVFSGTLDASSPTWNRGYHNGVDLTCANPLVDSSMDGMYYAEFCFRVTDPDTVTFVVETDGTTLEDTVLLIYCDPFDPDNPLQNNLAYNDDANGYYSAFGPGDGIVLMPGSDYHLVLSTFDSGDTGDFTITSSGNVTTCQQVANESLGWSRLKARYR